jgi:hypothetical protein
MWSCSFFCNYGNEMLCCSAQDPSRFQPALSYVSQVALDVFFTIKLAGKLHVVQEQKLEVLNLV